MHPLRAVRCDNPPFPTAGFSSSGSDGVKLCSPTASSRSVVESGKDRGDAGLEQFRPS